MTATPGWWNTHVHLFDPATFPYSAERTYTPPAAPASRLFAESQASNFLFVQATVEADISGLLHELRRLQPVEPDRVLRGAVLNDNSDAQIQQLERDAASLHAAGIRCIRIHGDFQSPSSSLTDHVVDILSGRIASVARRHNWSISLRLPIETWADLKDFLDSQAPGLNIIAEHCGLFHWPLSDAGAAALAVFISLLQKKLVHVKLGALHRRVDTASRISDLQPLISRMAAAGPRQLLWGNDWPHVDAAAKGLQESPFLDVNDEKELEVLRNSMSEKCFYDMLQATPNALFL